MGDKIKLSETGAPYVVIQILMVRGIDTTQTTQTPHIYTDYDGNDSPKMEATQNQKIFAIPYLKTKEDEQEVYKPYPPVLNVPVVRKAEPQTAFVTASNDPKYQGRVRIVYPWQTDNCGDMVKLKQAEEEYEAAQKTYLEKKQKQEQLEKELDVLKKEKQILDDNKVDKEKALKEIIDRLSELNKTLDASTEDDNLKNNVTEAEIDEAQEKIAPLEAEVNKKEADVVKRQAELKSLKSEKEALDKELEELERQKEELEKENALLQLKYNAETKKASKDDLEKKIKENEPKINSLKKQISGADDKGGLKATIKTIQDKIDKLELEKLDGNDNEESILYAESLLETEKKKLEAQREKYILLQQKKGIEDYFAELNGSTKKAIIDDQIAVEKDGKLTGGKLKEVQDAKDATKTAKDTLEKKEAAVDNLAKELQKVVSAMASPWIRMTSPMATDGGGTIFKPRLGDEVLVNYECGNVERPYVVGSLFSKNVLEPDERINRQVGPNLHKGASIAIVSPNGHGITFKDPSSGDGFVSSVYPGLGVVSKYSEGWGKKLPQAKDLAGGIKIGDRFGLYSIDMSSDKRSIKISSSLGTVSLNAFTGITISAPNGDIKIEGKNVSIKAGNNLEISSGNNIDTRDKLFKKFDWSGVLDGVEGMGKKVVSQAIKDFVSPFVDVSLARSVWETILRPVEGTALIKSHRYMKLEAGSGKAMIPHDRYTNKKYVGIDDSDKLNQTQQLIGAIITKIDDINSTINLLARDVQQKLDDSFTAMSEYKTRANRLTYLKVIGEPEIKAIISEAKGVVTGADPQWTDWSDGRHPSIFDNKLVDLHFLDKSAFYGYANDLGKAIFELTKKVAGLKALYQPDLGGLTGISLDVANALKDAFDELATEYQKKLNDYSSDLSSQKEPYVLNSLLLKRKWAALLLAKLSDKNDADGNRVYKFVFDCLGGKVPSDRVIKSNYEWNSFVSNLENYKMGHALLRAAFDTIIKKPLYEDTLKPFAYPVRDRLMWNDNEDGDILLSQDSNWTFNFKNGQLRPSEDANTGNLNYLKKLLLGLK